MGIYDRDYIREEHRGIQLDGQWSAVAIIIAINAAVFLANAFLYPGVGPGLNRYLALFSGTLLLEPPPNIPELGFPAVWTLVTHGFAHADFQHVFFNMLVLFIFGRAIEEAYGRRQFLQLYFSLLIFAGLGWMASSLFVLHQPGFAVGASGAVAGIAAVWVCSFRNRVVLLFGIVQVPGWLVGVLLFAPDIIGYQMNLIGAPTSRIAFSAHIAGALFGALFFYTGFTLFSLWPGTWGWLGGERSSAPRGRRPKLRVHQPSEDDFEEADDDLDAQVDQILEKIHTHGADSLTEEDRRVLEAASRRAQKKKKRRVGLD